MKKHIAPLGRKPALLALLIPAAPLFAQPHRVTRSIALGLPSAVRVRSGGRRCTLATTPLDAELPATWTAPARSMPTSQLPGRLRGRDRSPEPSAGDPALLPKDNRSLRAQHFWEDQSRGVALTSWRALCHSGAWRQFTPLVSRMNGRLTRGPF